jgi:hypothetical protein
MGDHEGKVALLIREPYTDSIFRGVKTIESRSKRNGDSEFTVARRRLNRAAGWPPLSLSRQKFLLIHPGGELNSVELVNVTDVEVARFPALGLTGGRDAATRRPISLPLYRPRRLPRHVIDHPAGLPHLIDDPGRDAGHEPVGEWV